MSKQVHVFLIAATLAITVVHTPLPAGDGAAFDTAYEKKLLDEYRQCTGDTLTTSVTVILRWRERIFAQTKTPQYRKLLEEYVITTGKAKGVVPCEVLNWHRKRLDQIAEQEKELEKQLAEQGDIDVDSIRLHKESTGNPSSPYDFHRIPFGVSKKVFRQMFEAVRKDPLIEKRTMFLVNGLQLDSKRYATAFHFDSKDRFHMYELQGQSYPADSLNKRVRPEAKLLVISLEKRFGEADHFYRIGYFDIKSGELSPYARWRKPPYIANAGIGLHDSEYYPKAIVEKRYED